MLNGKGDLPEGQALPTAVTHLCRQGHSHRQYSKEQRTLPPPLPGTATSSVLATAWPTKR